MAPATEIYNTIEASELGAWLRAQGDAIWWTVDGDPITAGEVNFPCPSDELAAVFEQSKRSLLVRDPEDRAPSRKVTRESLDALVSQDSDGNRVIQLRWHGQESDWLLVEDKEAAGISDAAAETKRG